jgi:hypothetical protein
MSTGASSVKMEGMGGLFKSCCGLHPLEKIFDKTVWVSTQCQKL